MSPPFNESSRWFIFAPVALLLGIFLGIAVKPGTAAAQYWAACEYDACIYDGDLRMAICEDMRQDERFFLNCRMSRGRCHESACDPDGNVLN